MDSRYVSAASERVRSFVESRVGASIGLDDDIFASGFVNSLLAIQLISFIEDGFSVTIEDDELDPDNFRSVRAILDFLAAKGAA
jgi:acyl carrier protein